MISTILTLCFVRFQFFKRPVELKRINHHAIDSKKVGFVISFMGLRPLDAVKKDEIHHLKNFKPRISGKADKIDGANHDSF